MDAEVRAVRAQLLGRDGEFERLASESAAVRTWEPYQSLQCPNERNPMRFTESPYSRTLKIRRPALRESSRAFAVGGA